jgi:hypothetical protein
MTTSTMRGHDRTYPASFTMLAATPSLGARKQRVQVPNGSACAGDGNER